MWGSHFCSVYRLHPSWSRRFCWNPLPSFGVFPALKVVPLWVSVLHLHTSLSVCNRDVSLSIPLLRLRNGDIPNRMLKSFRINHCMGIFMHDFLMVLTGEVSCLNLSATARYISFTFIPQLKSWAFCLNVRKNIIFDQSSLKIFFKFFRNTQSQSDQTKREKKEYLLYTERLITVLTKESRFTRINKLSMPLSRKFQGRKPACEFFKN